MPTSLFDGDPHRKTALFDSTVIREAQEGMEGMAHVLEASTAYCIIGKVQAILQVPLPYGRRVTQYGP